MHDRALLAAPLRGAQVGLRLAQNTALIQLCLFWAPGMPIFWWIGATAFYVTYWPPRLAAPRGIGQTLEGSFSTVSKPTFASKYAFESSRRDLNTGTPLHRFGIVL